MVSVLDAVISLGNVPPTPASASIEAKVRPAVSETTSAWEPGAKVPGSESMIHGHGYSLKASAVECVVMLVIPCHFHGIPTQPGAWHVVCGSINNLRSDEAMTLQAEAVATKGGTCG